MSYISRAGAGSVKGSPTRSYIAVRSYNNDIYSYKVSTDNISLARTNYVTTGVLLPVPGATASNCIQGNLLVENGKKLYPDANPGIITYMVGVFDSSNGIQGYIDPNSSAFTVQNNDRPYYFTSPGSSPLGGSTPDRAPPVFTRGVIFGQSDLDISGNGHIYGNFIVESTCTVKNMNVTGNLGVGGTTTLSNALYVGGATTLSNTLNVSGAATLSNTLDVVGATILSNTLNVSGAATLSNILTVEGATTLSNTLNVGGTTTLSNALDVAGATSLSNALNVGGPVALDGTLNVSSVTTLSSCLSVYGDAQFYSTMTVWSTLTAPYITGLRTLDMSGSVRIDGTLNVSSIVTLSSCLAVYGDAQFYSTMTVQSTLTTSSLTLLTGDLTVSQGNFILTTGSLHYPPTIIGTRALTAGLSGIINAICTVSSIIFLTYLGPLDGNQGVLSVKNILTGQFEIESDNGADGNVVQWMVVN